MKKKILVMSVMAFAFLFGAGIVHAATHYVQGYSSVDEREIRWGGSTIYSTQWNSGISTWNAMSKINIAPDSAWTYEDVTVSDVDKSNVSWSGRYTNQIGSDRIELNKFYLKDYTSNYRQHVTTHELGHALGLDHSTTGNIMYYKDSSQTSLGTQDKSDYGYLWGY